MKSYIVDTNLKYPFEVIVLDSFKSRIDISILQSCFTDRQTVKKWVDSNSVQSTAEEFKVHKATVYRWLSGKIPLPKNVFDNIKSRINIPTTIQGVDWYELTWYLMVDLNHIYTVKVKDLSPDGKVIVLDKIYKCKLPSLLSRIILRDWMAENEFRSWFVAEMFQVSRSTISMWMSGKRFIPERVLDSIKHL